MLLERILEQLKSHLVNIGDIHQQSLRSGNGRVDLPYALAGKYLHAKPGLRASEVRQRHAIISIQCEPCYVIVTCLGFSLLQQERQVD